MNLGWIVAIIIFIAWMVSMYGAGKANLELQSMMNKIILKYHINKEDIEKF